MYEVRTTYNLRIGLFIYFKQWSCENLKQGIISLDIPSSHFPEKYIIGAEDDELIRAHELYKANKDLFPQIQIKAWRT